MTVSKKKTPAGKASPARKAPPSTAAARPAAAAGKAKSAPPKPAPRKAAAAPPDRMARLERELAEAREQILLLIEDRDNQVALTEAADTERAMLQDELNRAVEKLRASEARSLETRGAGGGPEAAPGEEAEVEFEEDEEEARPSEDLDDVEGIYDRMDDPRVRRQELDRERQDRESEAGDEPYWLVCPKCGDSLEEIDNESVKMERCENCGGVYLDRGEVEMLLSLAKGTHGLRRVRNVLSI